MNDTLHKRITEHFYYLCFKCDNPRELEVTKWNNGEQSIEICDLCGFPENEGRIRIERR